MKKLLFTIILMLFSTSVFAQASSEVIRLSEPVQETAEFEIFGADVDQSEFKSPSTLAEIINSGQEEGPVTLVTSVAQVCQKKGCFFMAQDENYSARVTFKDYGFFIPTDSQGKEVVLIGDFSVQTLSEEQAKHYAEDAGDNPDQISGEQKEYSVVATSIVVPKSK